MLKVDLAGALALVTQIQDYESGKLVSIPLDLSSEIAGGKGQISFQRDVATNRVSWSLSISAAF